MPTYDAVVVGSGPNGLAAAIVLAEAKLSVLLVEAKSTIGGGMRSGELTLPGFTHDICSAIHPLGMGSPFFKTLPLEKYGLQWIQPESPLAHPLRTGDAVLLERSLDETCQQLKEDGKIYQQLMEPFVRHWDSLAEDVLAPLHFPKHPLSMARLGFYGVRSAQGLVNDLFHDIPARSLFAGLAAHSMLPLNQCLTSAIGMILGILGHAVGWPMPRGGTQNLANALASYFLSLGGTIQTDTIVKDLDELAFARLIFLDVTPKQLLNIAGNHLPEHYRKRLEKYRYGTGVFKMDWALNQPIPWKNPACLRAGTVHIGGTFEEIAAYESGIWQGKTSPNPFILLAQPTLFDPSRAPSGKHVAWGYCHVPQGSSVDMTERIETQIETFAPGFKDCILAKSTMTAVDMEHYNPNYVGGDINGGVQDLSQLFTRPVARINPYSTPLEGLYICSSSTPPGGGVHGMCGYHAAKSALETHLMQKM